MHLDIEIYGIIDTDIEKYVAIDLDTENYEYRFLGDRDGEASSKAS